MPKYQPTFKEMERAFKQYREEGYPRSLGQVDWFIAYEQESYPLRHTYMLVIRHLLTDAEIKSYEDSLTTDAAKSSMRHLSFGYVSLKAQSKVSSSFDAEVVRLRKDSSARKLGLASSATRPTMTYSLVAVYNRNPSVVAEVLERAQGVCECCGQQGPFRRANGGALFLEVHHIQFLSEGGADTPENAEALCPNCHRQKHFG